MNDELIEFQNYKGFDFRFLNNRFDIFDII